MTSFGWSGLPNTRKGKYLHIDENCVPTLNLWKSATYSKKLPTSRCSRVAQTDSPKLTQHTQNVINSTQKISQHEDLEVGTNPTTKKLF